MHPRFPDSSRGSSYVSRVWAPLLFGSCSSRPWRFAEEYFFSDRWLTLVPCAVCHRPDVRLHRLIFWHFCAVRCDRVLQFSRFVCTLGQRDPGFLFHAGLVGFRPFVIASVASKVRSPGFCSPFLSIICGPLYQYLSLLFLLAGDVRAFSCFYYFSVTVFFFFLPNRLARGAVPSFTCRRGSISVPSAG